MSRLVYNDARHTYALDGRWIPSVTGITGKLDKPGLVGWAANAAADWALTHRDELDLLGEDEWREQAVKASNRLRDASMLTGSRLHSIAERLVYGEPVEVTDPHTGEPYPDDVVRMGEQVARFLDAWDVTPDTALVECAVFNEKERYGGRFDLVAWVRGGERMLFDYKTGMSGVWPETALQCTGYAHATHVVIGERDMLMPPVDRCAALWVRPDSWELVPVKSDAKAWATFRHLLAVARWVGQRREQIIGAPLPVPEVVA